MLKSFSGPAAVALPYTAEIIFEASCSEVTIPARCAPRWSETRPRHEVPRDQDPKLYKITNSKLRSKICKEIMSKRLSRLADVVVLNAVKIFFGTTCPGVTIPSLAELSSHIYPPKTHTHTTLKGLARAAVVAFPNLAKTLLGATCLEANGAKTFFGMTCSDITILNF